MSAEQRRALVADWRDRANREERFVQQGRAHDAHESGEATAETRVLRECADELEELVGEDLAQRACLLARRLLEAFHTEVPKSGRGLEGVARLDLVAVADALSELGAIEREVQP